MSEQIETSDLFDVIAALPQYDVAPARSEQIAKQCRAALQQSRQASSRLDLRRRVAIASVYESACAAVISIGFLLGVFERALSVLSRI